MAITQYCVESDIQAILSPFAVTVRVDDNDDGTEDMGIVSAAIEKACTKINYCLLSRYTVTACAASSWVKWCAATLSAGLICTRRGNQIPQELGEECKEYLDTLEQIRQGLAPLMGDDGPAIPAFDTTATVSNLVIDNRFRRAKVRRVPSTSTGGPQTPGRLQNNATDIFFLQ